MSPALQKAGVILAATTAVSFVLAVYAGGVFAYVFLVSAASLVVILIAGVSRGSPPKPRPPAQEVPPNSPGPPLAIKPKKEPPVFPESAPFDALDPYTQFKERKQLAQRVESTIGKGHYLTADEVTRADAGPYELDRIGLYLFEEQVGKWPNDRSVHVRHEFERIEISPRAPSLMPLHYALRSFQRCIRQNRSELAPEERELLEHIHDYMKAHQDIDTTDKIKDRVDAMLTAKVQAPAAAASQAPSAVPADYDQIREKLFDGLLAGSADRLHIESLQMFVTLNEHGDALIQERYESVSSEGTEPIHYLSTALEPDNNGFVPGGLTYTDMAKGQSIEWKFVDEKATYGKAQIFFVPPITRTPISYTRLWTRFNAIFFNQRDKRESGSQDTTEGVAFPVRYRYDHIRLRVSFPERVFPGKFTVRARPIEGNGSSTLDEQESAWAEQGLDWDDDTRKGWVDVSRPLTGYQYELAWKLPATDADEPNLTTEQSETAGEFVRRIQSLANADCDYRAEALAAMQSLATDLETHFGGELRVGLYTYVSRGGKAGLAEILDRNGGAAQGEPIPIGRTPVGQSYRRSSVIVYQSVDTRSPVDKWFEPVPSERNLPNPAVAIAVPLLCPDPGGRRVAVLYMSTRTPESKLLDVWRGGPERGEFGRKVKNWYFNDLCNALKMHGVLQGMLSKPAK
jgi:hypothetical protein